MAVVIDQPGVGMTVTQQQAVPLNSPVVVSQPTTTVVNVITADPNHPRGVPRPWSTDICGCFDDCGVCLLAWLFPPCYTCHVSTKMGEDCCAPCCLGGSALVAMRAHTRARHNIQGSLINDACATCWCGPCVLCQLSRELDNIHSGRAAP